MKVRNRVVTVVAALAIAAIPTVAFAGNGNGHGNGNNGTTGPTGAKHQPRGHAYGFYCQGQSKKHVKGQKGTPFSQCVHAMKLLASGQTTNPAKACAALSKH